MTPEHLEWVRSFFPEMVQQPGLDKFMGLHIVEVLEGRVVLSMEVAQQHSNIYGAVHGGTLASIADVAMGFPCVTLGKRIVTIDMNISYIKSAPTGSTLTAVGKIISNGNTVIRSEGEIYNGEELLVKSQASYFIIGNFTEDDHPQPVFSEK